MKKIIGGGQKIVAMRGRNTDNGVEQKLEVNNKGESNSLTGVQKDNLVLINSATKDGFEIAHEGDSINFSMPNSKTRRGRVGVAQTLDTQVNQSVVVSTPNHGRVKGREYENEVPTLQQQMGTGGNNIPYVNNIRRLTEIECERLQGYKDNWTKFGNYDGEIKEISKTQRYKMCGNAVTVDIVELIGIKLLKNELQSPQ